MKTGTLAGSCSFLESVFVDFMVDLSRRLSFLVDRIDMVFVVGGIGVVFLFWFS